MPTSQLVRYVDVAVPRWLLGARFTNSVLNAGNIVPNATPCNSAMAKKNSDVNRGKRSIIGSQAYSATKQKNARYIPMLMTCVILPLSTCLPEKMREIASPTAMHVK